eukprot:scaffold3629_cov96-Isochrysis_galbana.AAC.1
MRIVFLAVVALGRGSVLTRGLPSPPGLCLAQLRPAWRAPVTRMSGGGFADGFGLSKRERTRLSRLRRPDEPLEEELRGLALIGAVAGALFLGGPLGLLVGFNVGPWTVRRAQHCQPTCAASHACATSTPADAIPPPCRDARRPIGRADAAGRVGGGRAQSGADGPPDGARATPVRTWAGLASGEFRRGGWPPLSTSALLPSFTDSSPPPRHRLPPSVAACSPSTLAQEYPPAGVLSRPPPGRDWPPGQLGSPTGGGHPRPRGRCALSFRACIRRPTARATLVGRENACIDLPRRDLHRPSPKRPE